MGGQQSKSSAPARALPERFRAMDVREQKPRYVETSDDNDDDDEKGELRQRERGPEALPLDVVAGLPSSILRDPKNR